MHRAVAVSISLIILGASICAGQESRAALLGRVTDSSDAVVPEVSVNIINTSTGVRTIATTNEQGNYRAVYLIPGIYQVVVEKPGFKRYQRDGIELRVSDRLELNISLTIGGVEETVTVTGESPLLDTTGASIGQVVDSRRLSELPIAHGNPYMLVALAPGVTSRPVILNNEPWHFYGAPFSMSGDKAFTNDLLIDGMPATHRFGGNQRIASETPMADLVAEFKVQTTIFDATTGNTEGGIVNYSTKAGGNAFHGTAYFVKMAPEMTANLFFANKAGQPRSDFSYARWGGTATGPVTVPKLYEGTNRTFFAYGYEGMDQNKPRGAVATVPTMSQRDGDFSALLALGSQYQIYDPSTRRSIGSGRIQSDPFPGNILPASRISPIAKNILSYYPAPNPGSGTADGVNNLPLPNTLGQYPYWNHAVRIDHNINAYHRLFGRFSASKLDCEQFDLFKNGMTGENLILANRSMTLDYVSMLSPSLVMNLRGGFVRFVREQKLRRPVDLQSLGFSTGYTSQLPDASAAPIPTINIAGYTGLGQTLTFGPRDTRAFQVSFDKVAGNHDIKFGMEYRAYMQGLINRSGEYGVFNFDATYTRGPIDNDPAAPMGQSLASLLLGLPTGGYVNRNASYAEKSSIWSFYLQDTWKLTRSFIVNLGLRYELEGPQTERYNRTVGAFDFDAPLPIEAAVVANYAANPTPEIPVSQFRVRGGATFPGVNGAPRALYTTDKNNVMPRVGFAYNVAPKTVIRGGFGLAYGLLGTTRGDLAQNGFSRQTQLVPTLDNGLTFVASLANPFPNGIEEPEGSSLGLMTDVGKSLGFFIQNPANPRAAKWQLSVQRELPGRIVLEAAYVGNRATNLITARDFNAFPNRYLSTSPVRDQARIDYLTEWVPNPFYPLLPGTNLAGTVITRAGLLYPHPHFPGGMWAYTSEGESRYNSFQARMERRFSKGLTVQAAYTWSRWNDAVGFLNAADPAPFWCVSSEDSPHRFSTSWIYELPFGRGRKWLSELPAAADVLLGGWQVNAIFTIQTYGALDWGNIIFTGNTDDIPLPRGQRTLERWFNVDAGFERDSRKQLSYNVRTFPFRLANVRADELNNWDLSIIKGTKIGEKINVQFRGEFINALNHVTFGAPSSNPASTAFGTVSSESSFPRQVQLGIKLLF